MTNSIDTTTTFDLKRILKALLLSTSESLSIKEIQAVITRYHQQQESIEDFEAISENPNEPEHPQQTLRGIMSAVPAMLTATQIRDAMDEIRTDLEMSHEVIRLLQGPQGYRITTSPELADWVRLLRDEPRPVRLRPAALETLTIIAYRQPVTRIEMEKIRGVSVDSALNRLLTLELIQITGRADLPGRPIQYGTTVQFLEFVGIQELEELPASDVLSPQQIHQWIEKTEEKTEEEISNLDLGLSREGHPKNSNQPEPNPTPFR